MNKLTKWILMLGLLLTCVGVQAQSQLEKELEDFRTWMSRKVNQGDSVTRAEWPSIKREFNSKTESLDRRVNRLSEKSRQEYSELKGRYRTWEEEKEGSYGQPLNLAEATKWELELTGRSDLRELSANQMREVWSYFLDQVRAKRTAWSLREWDYAEHVYRILSDRKQVVLDNMTNGDKIKVAALQVEFNTLRKSRDAKDMYQNMRENR